MIALMVRQLTTRSSVAKNAVCAPRRKWTSPPP